MTNLHPDTIAALVIFAPFIGGCVVWVFGHLFFT